MPRRNRHSSPPILSPTAFLPPTTLTDQLPLPKLLVFDLDYTLWPFWADTHPTPPLHSSAASTTTTTTPPKYAKATSLIDKYNIKFTTFEYTPILLTSFSSLAPHIPICLASRTQNPRVAEELLRGIKFILPVNENENDGNGDEERVEEGGITTKPMLSYITHKEIYPTKSKLVHFSRISSWWETNRRRKSHDAQNNESREEDLDWKDVIFFDDESRNRDVERQLGAYFCLVDEDVGVNRDVFDKAVWAWRGQRLGLTEGKVEKVDGVLN